MGSVANYHCLKFLTVDRIQQLIDVLLTVKISNSQQQNKKSL